MSLPGASEPHPALLRALLENQQVIWATVDWDGKARINVPLGPGGDPLIRPSELYGTADPPPWVDILGSPLERVLDTVKTFPARKPGFVALISVLKETPPLAEWVRQMLPGTRELDLSEYEVLKELGMEMPFGPWAQRDTARIFVLERPRDASP